MIPVIHRQLIYFLSTHEAKNTFIANPEKYLGQEVPRLPVPIRLAIVGPPKSGKTTGVYVHVHVNVIRISLSKMFGPI